MKSQDQMTQSLRLLVTELIRKVPDQKRIKELAQRTGVDYLEDPIAMMSSVLQSIDRVALTKVLAQPRQAKRKAHETSL